MSEKTLSAEERIAERMGIHPQEVDKAKELFYDSPHGAIMRALLIERINANIAEGDTKLRSVGVDELKHTQGKIAGLDLAIIAINQRT